MNAASPAASRKLWAAALAIAAVALSRKYSMGLTPDEIQSITDIALAAIGSQAGIDLAETALPHIVKPQPDRSPAHDA